MNRSEQIDHYKAIRARMGMAPPRRPIVITPPTQRVNVRALVAPQSPPPPPPRPLRPLRPTRPAWRGLPNNNKAPIVWLDGADTVERITATRIKRMVADYFNVSIEMLEGRQRNKKIVAPRFAGYLLASRLTRLSTPQIGRIFKRDHSSILHGVAMAERRMTTDDSFRAAVEELTRRLSKVGVALAYWGA